MAALTFKCPNCGGELVFDPDSGEYKCPFCQSQFTQEELDRLQPASATEQKAEEPQEAKAPSGSGESAAPGRTRAAGREAGHAGAAGTAQREAGEADSSGAVLYTCPSCGAQIVTDETTAATFCYYCHNPVVLSGRLSGDYLPDKIIPFGIGRGKAEEMFTSFVKSKKFVPAAFWNKKQIEKLTGVYYPYWEYDGSYQADLSARGTKTRVWVSGDTEYTETSIFQVERAGEIDYEDLLNDALKKADRALVENVQPFRLQETTDFRMSYLSGFMAEKRDIEKTDFEEKVRDDCRRYSEILLRDSASGYSTLTVEQSSSVPRKENWSYVLLPVYVLTYRGTGKKMYYFAMNGQTGNVCGKLPVDHGKLALWSGILGAIVFAVMMLIGYFI